MRRARFSAPACVFLRQRAISCACASFSAPARVFLRLRKTKSSKFTRRFASKQVEIRMGKDTSTFRDEGYSLFYRRPRSLTLSSRTTLDRTHNEKVLHLGDHAKIFTIWICTNISQININIVSTREGKISPLCFRDICRELYWKKCGPDYQLVLQCPQDSWGCMVLLNGGRASYGWSWGQVLGRSGLLVRFGSTMTYLRSYLWLMQGTIWFLQKNVSLVEMPDWRFYPLRKQYVWFCIEHIYTTLNTHLWKILS